MMSSAMRWIETEYGITTGDSGASRGSVFRAKPNHHKAIVVRFGRGGFILAQHEQLCETLEEGKEFVEDYFSKLGHVFTDCPHGMMCPHYDDSPSDYCEHCDNDRFE